jgi:hypothetical protein
LRGRPRVGADGKLIFGKVYDLSGGEVVWAGAAAAAVSRRREAAVLGRVRRWHPGAPEGASQLERGCHPL